MTNPVRSKQNLGLVPAGVVEGIEAKQSSFIGSFSSVVTAFERCRLSLKLTFKLAQQLCPQHAVKILVPRRYGLNRAEYTPDRHQFLDQRTAAQICERQGLKSLSHAVEVVCAKRRITTSKPASQNLKKLSGLVGYVQRHFQSARSLTVLNFQSRMSSLFRRPVADHHRGNDGCDRTDSLHPRGRHVRSAYLRHGPNGGGDASRRYKSDHDPKVLPCSVHRHHAATVGLA